MGKCLALGPVLLALLAAAPACGVSAQSVGIGLSAGTARFSVGSEDQSDFGLTAFAFLARTIEGARRQFVEAEVSLFRPSSPVIDESLRAFTVRGHVSFGSEWFVAPGLGAQYRSWSGPERVEESDWGPVLGVEAGTSQSIGDQLTLIPSVLLQLSQIELEGNVRVSFFELRTAIAW